MFNPTCSDTRGNIPGCDEPRIGRETPDADNADVAHGWIGHALRNGFPNLGSGLGWLDARDRGLNRLEKGEGVTYSNKL